MNSSGKLSARTNCTEVELDELVVFRMGTERGLILVVRPYVVAILHDPQQVPAGLSIKDLCRLLGRVDQFCLTSSSNAPSHSMAREWLPLMQCSEATMASGRLLLIQQ